MNGETFQEAAGTRLCEWRRDLHRLGGAGNGSLDQIEAFFGPTRAPGVSPANGIDLGIWQKFCRHPGLSGLGIPESHGGAGGGLAELCALFEAAGAAGAALPLFGHLAVAAQAILAGGSSAQRGDWLPRIASGEVLATDGYCPDLDYSSGRLRGTAQSVPHGAFANLFLVSNDSQSWLVAADAAGLTIECAPSPDPLRPLAKIQFDNALAEPLENHHAAGLALHAAGYLALAAEAAGVCRAAIEQMEQSCGSVSTSAFMNAAKAAQLVHIATELVLRRAPTAQLNLHMAKAGATECVQLLAHELTDCCRDVGSDETYAALLRGRALGLDMLMGPASWHRQEIARLLRGQ